MEFEACALCSSERKQHCSVFNACPDTLKYFPSQKMCIWSLHMRLVLPVLNHKIQSYILLRKEDFKPS